MMNKREFVRLFASLFIICIVIVLFVFAIGFAYDAYAHGIKSLEYSDGTLALYLCGLVCGLIFCILSKMVDYTYEYICEKQKQDEEFETMINELIHEKNGIEDYERKDS